MFDLGWSTRVAGVCRPVRHMKGVGRAWFISNERNQTPMNKIVHYIGLDVHKESIAVSRQLEERAFIINAKHADMRD